MIITLSKKESSCSRCQRIINKYAPISLMESRESTCQDCAGLGGLEFLPQGDATLTRRARILSDKSEVVVAWDGGVKKWTRVGLLLTPSAISEAKKQCEEDKLARQSKTEQSHARYTTKFALAIRKLFPLMPTGREYEIAAHACAVGSGRIGRTTDAKKLDQLTINLAVAAHVRHTMTNYDEIIHNSDSIEDRRELARSIVQKKVSEIMSKWQGK